MAAIPTERKITSEL